LLRVLDDKAIGFTPEPISPEESKGIEFKVTNTAELWTIDQSTVRQLKLDGLWHN